MRRSLHVLVGLLLASASQVAGLWAAVLIGKSSALKQFQNLGPGSLGDIILALVLTLDAMVAGVLTLVLRRHRGCRAVALSTTEPTPVEYFSIACARLRLGTVGPEGG